jgi:hypothetical protein
MCDLENEEREQKRNKKVEAEVQERRCNAALPIPADDER